MDRLVHASVSKIFKRPKPNSAQSRAEYKIRKLANRITDQATLDIVLADGDQSNRGYVFERLLPYLKFANPVCWSVDSQLVS